MKKWIGMGLTLVLTASLLAGCAGNGNGNKPAEQKPANEQANNGEQQQADDVKKEPVKFSFLLPTTVSSGYHTRVPDLNKDEREHHA